MDDIKRSLFIGLFGIVVQGSFGTDENLSEKLIIQWESDAVSWGRVVKVLSVELGDLTDTDEIDGDALI